MHPVDDELREQICELLYDPDDIDNDVLRDIWLVNRLVIRCCDSHVPRWDPFPWAFCPNCWQYSMIDHFDIFQKEALAVSR